MTVEHVGLGVVLWGLAGAGFALVWLVLPWPKASRALKPLGCTVCVAGWGTGIVAATWSARWFDVALLTLLLGTLSLPHVVAPLRGAAVALGGFGLFFNINCARATYGVALAHAMLAWAAAWSVAAALVAVTWRESAVPADLDRDLPEPS